MTTYLQAWIYDDIKSIDDNWLAEIARNRKPNTSRYPGNVGAKVEHQHDRRIDTLDQIQDMVL